MKLAEIDERTTTKSRMPLQPTLENIKHKFSAAECYYLEYASAEDFENAPEWLDRYLYSDRLGRFQGGRYACALSPIKDVMVVNLFHYNGPDQPELSMVATKTGFINTGEATENDIPDASDVDAPMFESLAALSVFHSPIYVEATHENVKFAREVMKLEVKTDDAARLFVLFEDDWYPISMIGVPEVRQAFKVGHLIDNIRMYAHRFPYPSVTFTWRDGKTFFNRHIPECDWRGDPKY